jgi:hypothetical protein
MYHLRFIPEEVAEASRIFFPDSHVLPKLLSYEEHFLNNNNIFISNKNITF